MAIIIICIDNCFLPIYHIPLVEERYRRQTLSPIAAVPVCPVFKLSRTKRYVDMKIRKRNIALMVLCAALAQKIYAQGISRDGASGEDIETIVVTATRTEKPLAEVPATVTVIDSERAQREIANNISQLVRYEPGVSVSGGGRYGLNGFTIRGITGDRVLTLVDETPTADEFSFGPFMSSRRNFVDIDVLKSVEIVRGPGSSAFGSNAIGGVVNFVTKDPIDYLHNSNLAGSVRVGYHSVDASTNSTAMLALGDPALSAMLLVTHRDFAETKNFFDGDNTSGPGRRAINPQDAENLNLFAKLVWAPGDKQSVTLTAERFQGDTETDVLSLAGTVSRGSRRLSERGIDERTRNRLSLRYRLAADNALFDDLSLLLYGQKSLTEQRTFQVQAISGPRFRGTVDRTRRSTYEQQNIGFRLQMDKSFALAGTRQRLSYGADYDLSESETLQLSRTLSRADGRSVRERVPFPSRGFPISEYSGRGLFIQNDIEFPGARLSLIPALRYDTFKLKPEADRIYREGNPGGSEPVGFDESQLSLKFGGLYRFTDDWSLFAQYAEGFRAPPLDAINTGFTNLAGGYTALSSPNLRPEAAESLEAGIRYGSDNLDFDAVVYRNDYEDFIQALAPRGFNPATRLREFQAINLPNARISGVELRARVDLSLFGPAFAGWQSRLAYARAEGENRRNRQPINSIDPQQLVLGVAYDAADGRWGAESVLTLTAGKDAKDIDTSTLGRGRPVTIAPFTPSGYALFDLIGYYNFGANLRLNIAVYNLTDKRYFTWGNDLTLPANSPQARIDRLSAAGRNFAATLKYSF